MTEASLVSTGGEVPLEIPSETLKTNKNLDLDVGSGTAVDLMVDFHPSGSIVAKQDGCQLFLVERLHRASLIIARLNPSADRQEFEGLARPNGTLTGVEGKQGAAIRSCEEAWSRGAFARGQESPS